MESEMTSILVEGSEKCWAENFQKWKSGKFPESKKNKIPVFENFLDFHFFEFLDQKFSDPSTEMLAISWILHIFSKIRMLREAQNT